MPKHAAGPLLALLRLDRACPSPCTASSMTSCARPS